MKQEEDNEVVGKLKDQNLIKLEGIKTQTWHIKPLVEAFDELGYDTNYKTLPADRFRTVDPNVE